MTGKELIRFLALALIIGCQVLLTQCGASPVVVPADLIDTTSGVLPGDPYPRVSSVQPNPLTAYPIPLNTNCIIVFSLPVDATAFPLPGGITVSSSSAGLLTYGTNYSITPTVGTSTSAVITFSPYGSGTPSCPIPAGDTITVNIGSSITSGGLPINNPGSTSFTVTGITGFRDTISPVALTATRSPSNGATNVLLTSTVSIQFTEASGLDNSSINPNTVYITDTLTNIIPCTRTISGPAPTWTVTLTPSQPLLPGRTYNVVVDVNKVRDLSGNIIGGVAFPWSFSTINSDPYPFGPGFEAGFPRVDLVTDTGTEAIISWDTTKPVSSVFLYGRNNSTPPAPGSASNASFITSGSADITGLTPGKQYYYRTDITDITPSTTSSPIGVFITPTVEAPVTVIAPPTLTNQTIAYAGERVRSVTNSGALVVWSDFSGAHVSLHGQLYDNSFTAQWGVGVGADLFTEAGHDYFYISSAEDFEGDFILLASQGGSGIYAKRISSAGGVVPWGATSNSQAATDTGMQISASGSNAWAVPVYTGTFTNVTNGTTTMNYSSTNYLYDPTDDFSSGSVTVTGDVVMDPVNHNGTTVSTTNFRYVLNQTVSTIAVGNQYRIADGNINYQAGLAAKDHSMFGGTNYVSGTPATKVYSDHAAVPLPAWLTNNDTIQSVSSGFYGQVSGFTTVSPTSYESNSMTHVTGHLFDGAGTPFTSVANGDLVQNTVSTSYAHVTSKLSNNDLVLDADIFPINGEGYAVFHKLDSGSGTALIPNRIVKSVSASPLSGYFVYNTTTTPLTANLTTVTSINSPTEVVLATNAFGAVSQAYEMWSSAVEVSNLTNDPTLGYPSGYLVCAGVNFATTVHAHDLVYNAASSSYIRIKSPLTTLTSTDTVLLNNTLVPFASGDPFTIYQLVESGNASGVAPNRLYNSGASWNVAVGDVVEQTLGVYANVTAAGTGVNEIFISPSLYGSGSNNYTIYNKLPTGTSQMFLGNHLTRSGATWLNTTVGYLVDNTSVPAVTTVNNWLTSTDLLLNLSIFTALGQNYSMYSDYCSTHPGAPSIQSFGNITADWNINITNGNAFNLYHYRGHTGTATALPADPLLANAVNFSGAGVIANDLAFNFTNPFGAPNPNYGPVLSLSNSYALSLSNAVFADGQTFYILRYPFNIYGADPTRIRTHGTTTSVLVGHCMDTANSFATVSTGDYLYDISTQAYALVTAVAGNNLTLFPTTFSMASGDRYVVVRQRNVLYVWQSAPNIVGRVISYDKLGALTIPTDVRGSLGAPFTIVANAQNPYAFSDEAGGSILVYEDNGTGQIVVQLLNGLGNLGASILADNAHASQTITKAIPDGHGGVVILYKYNGGAALAAQWIQNNSGALSIVAPWLAGGNTIITASTTDDDFAFNYNAGAPYVVAVWSSAANQTWVARAGNGAWAAYNLCSYPSVQDKPHVFLSGANTLITWEDRRWTGLVGYGIYGMKISDATGAKDAIWHANQGGVNDFNGIPLMMNKYNKNSVNNLIVPFNRIGPALPTNMRLIWEDTRNKTTQAVDILSYDITTIVP